MELPHLYYYKYFKMSALSDQYLPRKHIQNQNGIQATRNFPQLYHSVLENTRGHKTQGRSEPSYKEGEKFRKNSCLEASRTQRPAEGLGTAKNSDQLLSISNEGTRGGNRQTEAELSVKHKEQSNKHNCVSMEVFLWRRQQILICPGKTSISVFSLSFVVVKENHTAKIHCLMIVSKLTLHQTPPGLNTPVPTAAPSQGQQEQLYQTHS